MAELTCAVDIVVARPIPGTAQQQQHRAASATALLIVMVPGGGDDVLAKAAGNVLRHLLLAEVGSTMLKLRLHCRSRAKPTTTVRWMLREPPWCILE